MKKLNYILAILMVSLFMLNTSCEKPDEVTPEEPSTGIQTSDLLGRWNFETITYESNVYDSNSACSLEKDQFTNIDLLFKDSNTVQIFNNCSNDYAYDYSYTINDDKLYINTDLLVFQILSINNDTLKMKLTSSDNLGCPIGGTYVFKK